MLRVGWIFLLLALACPMVPSAALAQDAHLLPEGVQDLIYKEQVLIDRSVNVKKIKASTNKQDPHFAPETREIFRVRSAWIPVDGTYNFTADSVSPEIKSLFHKSIGGRDYVRILIHPESEEFYSRSLTGAIPAEDFWSSATSSSRTCLVWLDGHEKTPFFAKMSLDRELAEVVRTIPLSETVRSVGTTQILDSEKNLPSTFRFLKEVFSLIPKGMDRGGMIIREIPKEILSGETRLVPLFSLYARNLEGDPLLVKMIKKSGLSADEFIFKNILRPFAEQWKDLAVNHGITMEPHAQNVLLGVGPDGLPNGTFWHRDLGGFAIDFAFRDENNFERPANLATAKNFDAEYHQHDDKKFPTGLRKSIETFFNGGFIFNLDSNMAKWEKMGILPKTNWNPDRYQKMFWAELARQMEMPTTGPFNINTSVKNSRRKALWTEPPSSLSKALEKARSCFLKLFAVSN